MILVNKVEKKQVRTSNIFINKFREVHFEINHVKIYYNKTGNI